MVYIPHWEDVTERVLNELNTVPNLNNTREPCVYSEDDVRPKTQYPESLVTNRIKLFLSNYQERLKKTGSEDDKIEILRLHNLLVNLYHDQNITWLPDLEPISYFDTEFIGTEEIDFDSDTLPLQQLMKMFTVDEIKFSPDNENDVFMVLRDPITSGDSLPQLYYVYTTRDYIYEVFQQSRPLSILYFIDSLIENDTRDITFPSSTFEDGQRCLRDTVDLDLYPFGWDYIYPAMGRFFYYQPKFSTPRPLRRGIGLPYQLKGAGKQGLVISPVSFPSNKTYIQWFSDPSLMNYLIRSITRFFMGKWGFSNTKSFETVVSLAVKGNAAPMALGIMKNTVQHELHQLKEVYFLNPVVGRDFQNFASNFGTRCMQWWRQNPDIRGLRIYTTDQPILTNFPKPEYRAAKSGFLTTFHGNFSTAFVPTQFWLDQIVMRDEEANFNEAHKDLIPGSCIYDALKRSMIFDPNS